MECWEEIYRPLVTLSTTYLTPTGPESNLGLHGEEAMTEVNSNVMQELSWRVTKTRPVGGTNESCAVPSC
jgi:hypothetical protein